MLWITCVLILYVGAVARADNLDRSDWLDVNTAQGPVRGHRDASENIYVFYNIPYATAPSNENKFKAPLPPPTWTVTYDAVDKGIICPQLNFTLPQRLMMNENCLVANVYVPDTTEANLSVLVYVHGGGFQVGYGDMITLKYFMRKNDTIVVTFNYRLGMHGFLCLGTEAAPGNAGLKDQVALLRWLQQNIAAFGGNPNDVTVAGYSVGASSVDMLMISKSAEGLFHKIIPESGSSLSVYAVNNEPLETAKNYARSVNFTNVDDINALEQFYMTLSYDIILSNPAADRTDSTIAFVPCIEHDTGDEPFLTESPLIILKRGDYNKVPLLYGFTSMEGLLNINLFDTWKIKMNESFSDFLPGDLQFESESEKENVAKQIKSFYFGDEPIDDRAVLGYIDYFTDVMFAHPMLRATKLHVEAGHDQVYLYEYSFVDEDTPFVPYSDVRGVDHCAQTMAVVDSADFKLVFNEDYLTEEYKTMKRIIREMWHNFVKTSKPVTEGSSLPAWPAVGVNRSPHMSLGQEVVLGGRLWEARAIFWDNIYAQYYREPTSSTSDIKERFTLTLILMMLLCNWFFLYK